MADDGKTKPRRFERLTIDSRLLAGMAGHFSDRPALTPETLARPTRPTRLGPSCATARHSPVSLRRRRSVARERCLIVALPRWSGACCRAPWRLFGDRDHLKEGSS